MVCFADTDGPCLITAADSGAEFGYKLLLLQIVLAPILFIAQELTVRLGLLRGMGLVGLLKVDAGRIWAMLVAAPLLVSCFIGLLSEYSAIGQTMTFWGWPVWVTNSCITCLLLVLALSGSYNFAEKVGLSLGACQMLLFVTMFMAKPNGEEVLHQVVQFPFQDSNYIKLVTSNIGAVIMPWMLAYQQSAVCDKGLSEGGAEHLKLERIDTFVGSFLTQGVMAAMLVTVGAAIQPGKKVETVDDLLTIFARVLGSEDGGLHPTHPLLATMTSLDTMASKCSRPWAPDVTRMCVRPTSLSHSNLICSATSYDFATRAKTEMISVVL